MRHKQKPNPSGLRYLLKNISKNDIILGDLRYKIPAGRTYDLLSPTSHLNADDIILSRNEGSIAKRLGKTLVEVHTVTYPPKIYKSLAEPTAINFPQRTKSSITIGMGDLTEEVQTLTINEDEEFLRQIEADDMLENEVPLTKKG